MAVSFDTLQQGAYSGISDAVEAAVTSKEEWGIFWEKHASTQSPAPVLPDIPFDTDMVIYVFCGERSSGGHSVSIKSIEASGGNLKVVYETISPPPGGVCTMAMTQPHHMVRLKKCDLPVTFSGTAAPAIPASEMKFLVTFDAAKKEAATQKINSMSEVVDVRSMFDGDILCVQVDAAGDAQSMLKSIDGVASVERDG